MAAGQTSTFGVGCATTALFCLEWASGLRISASIFKTLRRWDGIFSPGDTPEFHGSCRLALFPFDVLLETGGNNFQRRADSPEDVRQCAGERSKEVYEFLR